MFTRFSFNSLASIICATLISVAAGCAGAKVESTKAASKTLPRPDMLIVHDFAVTPAEVKLDRGVMATAMRDAGKKNPSDEEAKVGRMVADKLSERLVQKLTSRGISAVRARDGIKPSKTTAVLDGQFITVDQGNQSARVWIGFGLGAGELRTRAQMSQDGRVVAEAETHTESGLKPGMVLSIATGSAALGAAGAGANETFIATVEADASRTADAVAKRIIDYYVQRGWLAK